MSKRENILTLLKDLQQRNGYLTKENLVRTAQEKEIPLNEVFSVASFYSFFSTKPQGKYVIRLCKSLPCYMKGSSHVLEALKEKLGIAPGGTTEDKKFSLELVNCIGACDIAPAALINKKLYGNLTKERINEIIDECK